MHVQDNLLHEIGDITSSYSAVVKAVQNIELLKAEGLSVAQVSNPLTWFANSQREYLQQRLRHVVERHIETVTSVVAAEVVLLTCLPDGKTRLFTAYHDAPNP